MENSTKGYAMVGFAVLVIALGSIGYTFEGEVDDIPTPNIDGFVFFGDEALPSNALALLVSAETTMTWDRDDIFIVIADEEKKDQCDGLRANGGGFLFSDSSSQTCQYGDDGYEAKSFDSGEGLTWDVASGEHFAGIGTKSGALPAGSDLSIDYSVKLSASIPTYLFSVLLGLGGAAMTRME
tara:strand:- start:20182 stop:20727 length:546 start_codon:yes stop_codon:yes gene_type:complete